MTTVAVTLQDTKSVVVIPESSRTATVYQKGDTGKSAYQSYVDTTEDDPVLTEEQWSAADNIWYADTETTIKPYNNKTVDGSNLSGEIYGGLFQP